MAVRTKTELMDSLFLLIRSGKSDTSALNVRTFLTDLVDTMFHVISGGTYTKDEIDNKLTAVITNLDWQPSVATYADLSTAYPTPKEGWTVTVNDTNVDYRWNGSEWLNIGDNSAPLVTATQDGRMRKEDKSRLDGIHLLTDGVTSKLHSGDWNTAISAGFYMGYNLTNAPLASTWFWVMVQKHNDSYVQQTAYSFNDSTAVYYRRMSAGVWSSWFKVVTGNEVTYAAPYANTIPRRDNNGTLFASHLFCSGANSWITADSLDTGGDATDQSAGLTLGESGKKGAAAVHLVYIGNGYSYLGMGAVDATTGLPAYWVMRMHYLSPDAYFARNITAAGSITANSDERLKTNIAPYKGGLEKVLALEPVWYDRVDNKRRESGFIAQAVREVDSSLVLEDVSEDKMLSLDYSRMVVMLTAAIQEQQKELQYLKRRVLNLERNKPCR
jgi:hypothetical protein